jgi:hypothetical protein
MSFELENPEIAGFIALYKSGQIAYQDAKDKIVLYIAQDKYGAAILSERQMDRLKEEVKELLLGKENVNVESTSQD